MTRSLDGLKVQIPTCVELHGELYELFRELLRLSDARVRSDSGKNEKTSDKVSDEDILLLHVDKLVNHGQFRHMLDDNVCACGVELTVSAPLFPEEDLSLSIFENPVLLDLGYLAITVDTEFAKRAMWTFEKEGG